jgi:hypothetical protein
MAKFCRKCPLLGGFSLLSPDSKHEVDAAKSARLIDFVCPRAARIFNHMALK